MMKWWIKNIEELASSSFRSSLGKREFRERLSELVSLRKHNIFNVNDFDAFPGYSLGAVYRPNYHISFVFRFPWFARLDSSLELHRNFGFTFAVEFTSERKNLHVKIYLWPDSVGRVNDERWDFWSRFMLLCAILLFARWAGVGYGVLTIVFGILSFALWVRLFIIYRHIENAFAMLIDLFDEPGNDV